MFKPNQAGYLHCCCRSLKYSILCVFCSKQLLDVSAPSVLIMPPVFGHDGTHLHWVMLVDSIKEKEIVYFQKLKRLLFFFFFPLNLSAGQVTFMHNTNRLSPLSRMTGQPIFAWWTLE